MKTSIHPTAIVHPNAEIDRDVTIGPFCVIDADVRVGAGCRLYQNVYVTGWTEIGPDCVLHPGVIVGHDPQDSKYKGEKTYCRIGRATVVREYSTIHRGTTPESATVVGESCFLLAGSHIGHNCSVGNKVTVIQNAMLGGHAFVGDGVTIGGNTGIHQFVRVGELAMLAGHGRVVLDVVPYALADTHGCIAGLNRVGLRRAGMATDHVRELQVAFRLLFSRKLPFREAVEEVAERVVTPPGRQLLEFLRAESKRGLAGGSRGRKSSNSWDDESRD